MHTPSIAVTLSLLAAPALAQTPVVTVLTYDSFIPDWGPGPAIEAGFEATCGCDLRYVAAGDGVALLSRLTLEGPRTDADVILGLDSNLIARARETGLLAPHGIDVPPLNLPVDWSDDTFVPFDWGYFAFVHRTGLTDVPDSLQALAASDTSVIIQDPRSSTPGLGLVLWAEAALDDPAAFWAQMSDNVVTVTPGWSEAYALFLEGESDMVLSYTTSPAYHAVAEDDDGFAAAPFAEGHYLQVEVAARVAGSDVPDLASDFLAYLVSAEAQAVLPTTNWMYPAAGPAPEAFATLISPDPLLLDPAAAEDRRAAAVEAWRTALTR